jgi:hypothetical protein
MRLARLTEGKRGWRPGSFPEPFRFDNLQQRRLAALKTHDAADQTGPDPGRRRQSQSVGYADLDFGGTQALRPGLADLVQRNKLEVNAMIRQ